LVPLSRDEKSRLEAFSDGVLAIIITIMALEMKVPHTADLAGLKPVMPVFLSYVLSFIYLGIYWNNHHHLSQATEQVGGGILSAILHLLFLLSLFLFTTGWMGENGFASMPTAVYGLVLLMAAIAYYVLQRAIISREGRDSLLAQAIGRDGKGKLSPGLYLPGILLAFVSRWNASGSVRSVATASDAWAGTESRLRPLPRADSSRTPRHAQMIQQGSRCLNNTAGSFQLHRVR
jgi:uncharacterized membrane protein